MYKHTHAIHAQGRKILSSILDNSRAIIRDVYSFLLRPQAAATGPNVPDDEAVVAISDDLRRRLDILFAFIRQSVRECEFFCDGSDVTGLD